MKRFFIGTLAVIAVFFACISAWGQVVLPNTFVTGTTAKASEVNANFDKLAKALPGANWYWFQGTTPTIGTSVTSLGSLTINAPSSGWILLTFSGSVSWTAAGSEIWFAASGNNTQLQGPCARVPSTGTATLANFSTQLLYAINAGSNTFYANGRVLSGSSTQVTLQASLTAVFFPTGY
jgi:hypothetical protein